jgi:hypothetical protein
VRVADMVKYLDEPANRVRRAVGCLSVGQLDEDRIAVVWRRALLKRTPQQSHRDP